MKHTTGIMAEETIKRTVEMMRMVEKLDNNFEKVRALICVLSASFESEKEMDLVDCENLQWFLIAVIDCLDQMKPAIDEVMEWPHLLGDKISMTDAKEEKELVYSA